MSPNDWPAAYAVYVSNGINWGNPVVTGSQPSSVVIISLPEQTVQYVRVVQTGRGKTQNWSIHEFYLAYIGEDDGDDGDDGEPLLSADEMSDESTYLYLDHKTLYIYGYEQISANTRIKIFNTAGQNVLTTGFSENGISLEHLPAGLYIVVLQNGNKTISRKIIIN